MSKPKTLLEDLCEHALSCGAQSIEVEYKDGREWVFARKGETAFGTANFESSSRDAKELRENLYAARKKSVRTAIGGRVWILKVGVYDSFGEDAFRSEERRVGKECRSGRAPDHEEKRIE